MTWTSRVRVESQELYSHFVSMVCKTKSMSSQMKFHIFVTFFTMKWHPICYKTAPNS